MIMKEDRDVSPTLFDARLEVGLALVDLDGKILGHNAALPRLLEQATELVGAAWQDLVSGDPLTRLSRDGLRETEYVTRSGRVVSVIADPIAHAGQDPARVVFAVRDTTDRTRAEVAEALLRLAEAVGSLQDLNAILETIARITPELLGQTRCVLFLLDASDGVLTPAVAWGLSDDLWPTLLSLRARPKIKAVVEAIESKKPIAVTAEALGHLPRRIVDGFSIRSMLIIPLVSHGRVVGTMTVDTPGVERSSTPKDIAIAQGIAAHAAIAIDRARGHAEAGRQREQGRALSEIGHLLSQSLDLREVQQRIVDNVRRLLGVQGTDLYELDPGSEALVARASSGVTRAAQKGAVFPKGAGVIGLAASRRRVIAVANVFEDSRVVYPASIREGIEKLPIRSVLAAPLLAKDKVVGVLAVTERSGHVFNDEEVQLVQAFVDHAALALQNAHRFAEQQQLLEETQRRRREEVMLETVVGQITSSLDVREVLGRVAEAAREVCGCDIGLVAPYDPEAGTARNLAASGARSGALLSVVIAPGKGIGGRVLETGEPFTTEDYLSDPRISRDYVDVVRAEGIVSEAMVPILAGQRIIGLLGVMRRTPYRFAPRDVEILTKLAAHAAIALENGRLYSEIGTTATQLRVSERRQAAIASLSQRVLEGTELQRMMDETVATVAEVLGVEYARILVLSPDGTHLLLRSGVGWKEGAVGRATVKVSADSTAGDALAAAGPVRVEDHGLEPRFTQAPLLREHGIVSSATVVINSLIPPFGLLGVDTRTRRAFTGDDIRFLQAAANVLAMAVARGRAEGALRRHADRLRTLREIDQAILAAHSPEEIGAAAVRRIGKLVGCWASIGMVDFERGESVVLAAEGSPGCLPPTGGRVLLTTADVTDLDQLRQGGIVIVQDVSRLEAPAPLVRKAHASGVNAYVRVPLVADGTLIGALNLASDRIGAFTVEHVEFAAEVAGSVAIALQQARLHEEIDRARKRLEALSRRLVEIQEDERRHLARELHDEVGQQLTALQFAVGAARDDMPGTDLGRARAMISDLTRQIRDLSLGLRPMMLDDLGLAAALSWHVQRYTRGTRIDASFTHDGIDGRRFASEVELAAYRIVQEALTNVARHARTPAVAVRAWANASTLNVQVEDHGAGLPDGAVDASSSAGLAGMRERVWLLGGRLEIESAPGSGVRVTAELPLGGGGGA